MWSLFIYLLSVVAAFTAGARAANQTCDDHCFPGQKCWPSLDQMLDLFRNIKGDVYSSYSKEYRDNVVMINTRVTEFPFFIVMAETVDDVIYTVKFTRKYNMKLTIRSSGHDFIGRSTWYGSVQLNLFRMKDLKFDLNSSLNTAGVVTAQSGNSWLRVYNETNKVGRVIVGGASHTVAMGGYTLGGGHSPIGRKFGLAVDNLLEVEMVTANGSLVYANEHGYNITDTDTGTTFHSSNSDIFWALRGGGGSTYGIVTAFTYRLHYDSEMQQVLCNTPIFDAQRIDVGRPFLQDFESLIASLAPEWGGYELISDSENNGTRGFIFLSLNHFGSYGSASFNTIQPFLKPRFNKQCFVKNVSNFLEYEVGAKDALYYRSYNFNRLLQPDSFTQEYYAFMYKMLQDPRKSPLKAGMGCTGNLIGGNMNKIFPDETAVNPSFRTAVMSMSCGLVWPDAFHDKAVVALAEEFTTGFLKFGKGTSYNEASAYLPNWKVDYWGNHYDRLLAIKKVWDPENFLTCLHCVGSDGETSVPSNPGFVG